ncbi:MAG: hypothetical protein AAGA29_10200 [Planctomycetota bacterium]
MPIPGKRWYHVTFSTYNSWLPGDPRGFRSRGHKLHSSGDHRNPPPKGEHAGLHQHAKAISGTPITLALALRPTAGRAMIRNMEQHGHRPVVVAVGGQHVHLLAELPQSSAEAKTAVGNAKLAASMKLKDALPGRVWAKGCNLKPIRDEQHQRNTFAYIERHRAEEAWVWTFREGLTG